MLSQPLPTARFNRAEFSIRAAEPGDRQAIMAIAAQVWDGHDYLPGVFDAWLNEPSGLFCVGVLAGQVVATAKLTWMAEGYWWMEGLRVDPAYRGLGIARIMHHYCVNAARQYAPGILRFSTASGNEAIIKIAGETGFSMVARYAPYGAAASSSVSSRLVQLSPAALERVWASLQGMPHIGAAQNTLEDSWRFVPLTRRLVAQRLAAGMVYGWPGDSGKDVWAGLVILNAPRQANASDESRLNVGYIDGAADMLPAMAEALRVLAADQGHPRVSCKVLNEPALLGALEAAGYERRWDMDVLLYARELSLTGHAQVVEYHCE